MKLTKEQVKALKKADALVFRYDGEKSFIKVIERKKNKEEKVTYIECLTRINEIPVRGFGEVVSACHVESHVKWTPHIQTMLSRIKEGDQLELIWVANYNNKDLNDASLYRDDLYLAILKKNGKREEFHIYTSVTKNDSTKMITDMVWYPLCMMGE